MRFRALIWVLKITLSRSLIFALLDFLRTYFRAPWFLRWYRQTGRTDCHYRTLKTGQPGQDREDSSVADPHPYGSAWLWSHGSVSRIRISNANSESGSSYSKISAEIWITNTIHKYYMIKNNKIKVQQLNMWTFSSKIWLVKISYTISWLAIVQQGHESASTSTFFPGSASAFFK
jgi:hypothetical protein